MRAYLLALLLPIVLTSCVTTPAPSDPTGPALAVAQEFQKAICAQNFAAAYSLVAEDFSSAAFPARGDLWFYFEQARDRGYFAPASPASTAPQATLNGDRVRVYPVGIRSRAGVAVFDLTLVQRGSAWKITSATVEFY